VPTGLARPSVDARPGYPPSKGRRRFSLDLRARPGDGGQNPAAEKGILFRGRCLRAVRARQHTNHRDTARAAKAQLRMGPQKPFRRCPASMARYQNLNSRPDEKGERAARPRQQISASCSTSSQTEDLRVSTNGLRISPPRRAGAGQYFSGGKASFIPVGRQGRNHVGDQTVIPMSRGASSSRLGARRGAGRLEKHGMFILADGTMHATPQQGWPVGHTRKAHRHGGGGRTSMSCARPPGHRLLADCGKRRARPTS